MTKLYNVQITKVTYKDDYVLGELPGTSQTEFLSTMQTTDLGKAINEFVNTYGDNDGKVYVDDDFIYIEFMKCFDGYGWRNPTIMEIEKWKNDECVYDIYHVEYQMRIWEMRSIENKELINIVKEVAHAAHANSLREFARWNVGEHK